MIFTRHQLEELEEQFLAPYAIRSKDSKGRKQPEDEPDYRTVFQRTGTVSCTQMLFGAWNIKPGSSSMTKATTIAPAWLTPSKWLRLGAALHARWAPMKTW